MRTMGAVIGFILVTYTFSSAGFVAHLFVYRVMGWPLPLSLMVAFAVSLFIGTAFRAALGVAHLVGKGQDPGEG